MSFALWRIVDNYCGDDSETLWKDASYTLKYNYDENFKEDGLEEHGWKTKIMKTYNRNRRASQHLHRTASPSPPRSLTFADRPIGKTGVSKTEIRPWDLMPSACPNSLRICPESAPMRSWGETRGEFEAELGRAMGVKSHGRTYDARFAYQATPHTAWMCAYSLGPVFFSDLSNYMISIFFFNNPNLFLLNAHKTPTHFSVATGGFSTIDLTLTSTSLASSLSWKTHPDLSDSNHFPIIISHNSSQPKNVLSSPKWILNEVDWPFSPRSPLKLISFHSPTLSIMT